jgi:hypothetical protein
MHANEKCATIDVLLLSLINAIRRNACNKCTIRMKRFSTEVDTDRDVNCCQVNRTVCIPSLPHSVVSDE